MAKSLTLQQIFNRAVKGLASQRWRRSISRGECAYRGPNGLKCAIGHVLTDEELDGYEGLLSDLPRAARIKLGYSSANLRRVSDLERLQEAHDEGGPKGMRKRFIKYAKEHKLRLPKELQP